MFSALTRKWGFEPTTSRIRDKVLSTEEHFGRGGEQML